MSLSGSARDIGAQVPTYIRKRLLFSDPAILAGVKICRLPARALITMMATQTVVAFNSATTDTIQLGSTNGGVDILAATTIHAIAGFTLIPAAAGMGLAVTGAGEVDVWAKYAQIGAAATAGDATIIIEFLTDHDG